MEVSLELFNRIHLQDPTPDGDRTMALILMVHALEKISLSLDDVAAAISDQPRYPVELDNIGDALSNIAKAIGGLNRNP